jgi:hypothetical protein
MAIVNDVRGNESYGSLDQIQGQAITDARPVSATLAAVNAESVISLQGHSTLRISAVLLGTGSWVVEGSVDGLIYDVAPINARTSAGLWLPTALSQAGFYIYNVAGYRTVRVRMTAATGGGVTFACRASQAEALFPPDPPSTHSATGAAGVAVTLSIPLPGAGLFNRLTSIRVEAYATAATVGAATPIVVTTTNLPNAPAFIIPTAIPIGEVRSAIMEDAVKSSVAATATTIVAPATPSIIWRITAVNVVTP